MARASAARSPARSSLARALMSGTLGGAMAWCTPGAWRVRGPQPRLSPVTHAGSVRSIQPTRHGLLLVLGIALRACAAEDALALRRQIGFQRLPGHESDIVTFRVGADGIGRIVEGETGALAGHGRWRQRHRANLEEPWFDTLEPFGGRGRAGVALLLLDLQRSDDGLLHRGHGRAAVGRFREERADADALVLGLVPQDGVDVGVGMGAVGVHVVVADDRDVAIGSHGANPVLALERPAAVAEMEEFRVLLHLLGGVGG